MQRASAQEIFAFVGLLVLFFAGSFAIGVAVAAMASPKEDVCYTQAECDELNEQASGAGVLGQLASLATSLGAMALMAPRVGYRRRDAFMLLIPIYGWIIAIKFLWRIACSQRHYWRDFGDVAEGWVSATASEPASWTPPRRGFH